MSEKNKHIIDQLDALIYLLEDPDEHVYEKVSETIIDLGEQVLPKLEESWEVDYNPLQQERIENIIHQIHFKSVFKKLQDWRYLNMNDLNEGIFLLNSYKYPSLDRSKLDKKIRLVAKDIWLELNSDLTPVEQINVFNHLFYRIHNFKEISHDKAKEGHYFLNHLLDTKKGSNITIGILYLILASHLNIPLYGVCLPDQFVLARTSSFVDFSEDLNYSNIDVQFYINPNDGIIFTRKEITKYLQKINVKRDNRFYYPSSNLDLLKVYMKELISKYEITNKIETVNELWSMYDILDESKDPFED